MAAVVTCGADGAQVHRLIGAARRDLDDVVDCVCCHAAAWQPELAQEAVTDQHELPHGTPSHAVVARVMRVHTLRRRLPSGRSVNWRTIWHSDPFLRDPETRDDLAIRYRCLSSLLIRKASYHARSELRRTKEYVGVRLSPNTDAVIGKLGHPASRR
jgi:hypothetical protein